MGLFGPSFEYKVMLCLDGSSFMGEQGRVDRGEIHQLAGVIKQLKREKILPLVMVGSGNIIDRDQEEILLKGGFKRETIEYMKVVPQLMNGVALEKDLSDLGIDCNLASTFTRAPLNVRANREDVNRGIREKDVVQIFDSSLNTALGLTANAMSRAKEHGCRLVVRTLPSMLQDGVRHEVMTYREALKKRIHIVDETALSFGNENEIPLVVVRSKPVSNLSQAVLEGDIGFWFLNEIPDEEN